MKRGQAFSALLGGEIQAMFVTPASGLTHIKAGKIRALAYNYPTRAAFLPDVLTMAEAGVPGMEMNASWCHHRRRIAAHGLILAKTTSPVPVN